MVEPAAKRLCTAAGTAVKKIAIEGNIAAGKSTFLRLLEDSSLKYQVVSEPITRWCSVPCDGEEMTNSQQCSGNLLDMFYKDQHRWAYTFQTYACISRVRSQLRPLTNLQPGTVLFYERSVYSDRFIFAYNCYKNGVMSDTEWLLYCDWHTFLIDTLPISLDGIIYLRTKPEQVCYDRLLKRNRPEEETVAQEYLEALHERHEDWLVKKSISIPRQLEHVPILTVNSSPEFETDPERLKEMMSEVHSFVKDL